MAFVHYWPRHVPLKAEGGKKPGLQPCACGGRQCPLRGRLWAARASWSLAPAHCTLPVCLQMCTSLPRCRSCGKSLLSLWSAVSPCTSSSICEDGSPLPATRSSHHRWRGLWSLRVPDGQSSSSIYITRHLWILQ